MTGIGNREYIDEDVFWHGIHDFNGAVHFPWYSDIRNVPDPEEGTTVYSDGSTQPPKGVWFYDGDRWFSGDRTRISAQAESVGGNSEVVLQQFVLPSDTEIDVWQMQVTNVSGADDGLVMRVDADGSAIASYDGSDHEGVVQIGDPIAIGGSGGDTITVVAQNTTGGSAEITGFVVVSIQSTLV